LGTANFSSLIFSPNPFLLTTLLSFVSLVNNVSLVSLESNEYIKVNAIKKAKTKAAELI
jgi:hypothetical protein